MTSWVVVILTSGMLQFGSPYSDKATCEKAAEKLRTDLDQKVTCIPQGDIVDPKDDFALNIMDLMQKLMEREVDKSPKE